MVVVAAWDRAAVSALPYPLPRRPQPAPRCVGKRKLRRIWLMPG